MTKEEYEQRVLDAANTLLTELDAAEWKAKNEDGEFHNFEHEKDMYDHLHTIIDSTCETTWKGAVEVLQITDQDPDQVDSGLFEGCGWQHILVCLAFECYSWDVQAKAQELFDNDEFEDYMAAIPTNQRQIGHFPDLQGYKIPDGPWVVNMHDAIKVLHGDPRQPDLSVVFEGPTEKRGTRWIVRAKRVYTQGGPDSNIQDDLKRCKEEFGVRLFPEGGSST